MKVAKFVLEIEFNNEFFEFSYDGYGAPICKVSGDYEVEYDLNITDSVDNLQQEIPRILQKHSVLKAQYNEAEEILP